MNYSEISSIEYDGNCSTVSFEKWNELMKGAKRANKKEIISILNNFGVIDKGYLR